jgi:AraC-like DNA-binding protein
VWSHRIVESNDPDEFVTLIRPSGLKMFVTERGLFEGHTVIIKIGRLNAQRRSERLARFVELDLPQCGVLFLTRPGPSMFWDGAEIGQEQLALIGSGNGHVSRLSGPTIWGNVLFDPDDMETYTSYFGHCASGPNDCTVFTPPPEALAKLRSLHAYAGHLAGLSPEFSMRSEAAYGLEQALFEAILECTEVTGVRFGTIAMEHHRLIVRRFREFLEAHPLRPFHAQQTSHAIGVSGRTLRIACQEHFGASPVQYLLLRRMHLAHRALTQADPSITRVTDVATELGFWELGRFSVKYRQIFGESPSATLRAACRQVSPKCRSTTASHRPLNPTRPFRSRPRDRLQFD